MISEAMITGQHVFSPVEKAAKLEGQRRDLEQSYSSISIVAYTGVFGPD